MSISPAPAAITAAIRYSVRVSVVNLRVRFANLSDFAPFRLPSCVPARKKNSGSICNIQLIQNRLGMASRVF